MPTFCAPSNIFPIDPSLSATGESESAGSYVAYNMGQNAAQPYRGSSRPSTAEHPTSSMRAEVQALTARVSMLQQQLTDALPADELQQLQQLCGKLEALDKVTLRPTPLRHGRTGHTPRPTRGFLTACVPRAQANRPSAGQKPSAPEGVAYFDSCAKFSGEASRVRDTGRLPFSSDAFKIVA
jgi:hypothetical protein